MTGNKQESDIVKVIKVCGICEHRNDIYGTCIEGHGIVSYSSNTFYKNEEQRECFELKRCLIPE